MKKRDILNELYNSEVTEDEAYSYFDVLIKSKYAGTIDEMLYMDKYEYTAFCHGAGLLEIAQWRYDGWPNKCAKTGEHFDYRSGGWFVKDYGGKSKLVLIKNL